MLGYVRNDSGMTICVIYCFSNSQFQKYEPLALAFTKAYLEHPPGECDHELVVSVNGGGAITPRQERLFEPLSPRFVYHDNTGKDLGGYLKVALTFPCDLLVCIGGPGRPCCAGWLDIIVQSVENNGPGVYGPWGFHEPRPHLKTTIFAITPQILTSYPHPIQNHTRYEFEFGNDNIALYAQRHGFAVAQVTRSGVFGVKDFHVPPREDCILLDQYSDSLDYK